MEEIGIDISDHRSKHFEEFLDQKVHTVVTVCGYADQACPIFPGMMKRYHWGFDDPAKATGSEEEVFAVFSPGARRNRESFRRLRCRYEPGNATVSIIRREKISESRVRAWAPTRGQGWKEPHDVAECQRPEGVPTCESRGPNSARF